MKGIDSTGAALVHVPGWMDGWVGGWVDGWMEVKADLSIAYSNQKLTNLSSIVQIFSKSKRVVTLLFFRLTV
jgi:hypothetical protein